MAVAMAANAADGSNLANTAVVAAGDLVDVEITKAASLAGGSPTDVTCTMEFV